MKKLRRRRPSPSILISSAALVVAFGALAGTAFSGGSAVPGKNGVKASDIAKDAVKSGKIKGAAVTTDKLADSAVTEAKLANGAVTDTKLGTITERTLPALLGDDGTIGDGVVLADAVTVPCLSTERVIGGGFSYTVTDAAASVAIRSSFQQGNGWRTAAINDSGAAQIGTHYAYCLS